MTTAEVSAMFAEINKELAAEYLQAKMTDSDIVRAHALGVLIEIVEPKKSTASPTSNA